MINFLKHIGKANKKSTNTQLIGQDFAVINDDGELKGTFQTEQEARDFAEYNSINNIYIIRTYKLTIKNKI